MGLLDKAAKLGLTKKAAEEARKPENQRRMKDLVRSLRDSRKKPRS